MGWGAHGCLVPRRAGGEGLAGELEAVEEDASTPGVDLVGGEAPDDLAEGELELAVVGGGGEGEAAGGAMASDGVAGGVMVVAEALTTERGGATGVAVGEEACA